MNFIYSSNDIDLMACIYDAVCDIYNLSHLLAIDAAAWIRYFCVKCLSVMFQLLCIEQECISSADPNTT